MTNTYHLHINMTIIRILLEKIIHTFFKTPRNGGGFCGFPAMIKPLKLSGSYENSLF